MYFSKWHCVENQWKCKFNEEKSTSITKQHLYLNKQHGYDTDVNKATFVGILITISFWQIERICFFVVHTSKQFGSRWSIFPRLAHKFLVHNLSFTNASRKKESNIFRWLGFCKPVSEKSTTHTNRKQMQQHNHVKWHSKRRCKIFLHKFGRLAAFTNERDNTHKSTCEDAQKKKKKKKKKSKRNQVCVESADGRARSTVLFTWNTQNTRQF